VFARTISISQRACIQRFINWMIQVVDYVENDPRCVVVSAAYAIIGSSLGGKCLGDLAVSIDKNRKETVHFVAISGVGAQKKLVKKLNNLVADNVIICSESAIWDAHCPLGGVLNVSDELLKELKTRLHQKHETFTKALWPNNWNWRSFRAHMIDERYFETRRIRSDLDWINYFDFYDGLRINFKEKSEDFFNLLRTPITDMAHPEDLESIANTPNRVLPIIAVRIAKRRLIDRKIRGPLSDEMKGVINGYVAILMAHANPRFDVKFFWVSTPGNSKNIVPTKKLKE
jgi:hypothetical protein